MKRISTAIFVTALAAMSTTALAADSVFPSAAQESPPLLRATESFMDRNRESAHLQRSFAGPSSALESDPIQSRDTYMLRHLRDIETQRSVPFPYSVQD
jgi:hypothetical protein